MKQLLIIAFIFSSLATLAQTNPRYFRRNAPVMLLHDSLGRLTFSKPLKSPAPGIYSMQQDGMPCIIPDTKEITPIPNAWKGAVTIPFSGNIPNPAVPKVFTLRNKKTG